MLKIEKGVKFDIINEQVAIHYLKDINNYLRTASYRKNYEKHTMGKNEGKYINLDFAYLCELSSIDMQLRYVLLQMCIDLEHSLKISLISSVVSNSYENGYNIVDLFLEKYPEVLYNIEKKVDSIFTGNLIEKYFSVCYVFDAVKASNSKVINLQTKIFKYDCPIWVFVEIISLGDLIKLITFYNNTYKDKAINSPKANIMNPIKSLRNACAHNNCLLNNLKPSETNPTEEITQYIALNKDIGKEERIKKLSCRPIFEIICLLYAYTNFVSKKVKIHRLDELKSLIQNRMYKNFDYFEKNDLVKTTFNFLKKAIDNIN